VGWKIAAPSSTPGIEADADPETAAASVEAVGVALEIVDVHQDGAMHEVVASWWPFQRRRHPELVR
jgi:hypothetical protein